MFYLNEIILRLIFSLFYLLCLFLLCFLYRHLFFYFFSIPILKTTNHLIYTNPFEFITYYLIMILIVCFVFCSLYFVWHVLDFLKSGLYSFEYKKKVYLYIKNLLIFFIFNVCIIFFFIPYSWNSFKDFNNSLTLISTLNTFLELRVFDYFIFLQYNLIILNLVFLFFYSISYVGLEVSIEFRKLFCLFNIIFSTFFSPPDIYSQLSLLIYLQLFFELYILITILKFKFQKYLKIF